MDKVKPTIVFLHGALGVANDMTPLMKLLEEKDILTVAFNFSGHGPKAQDPSEFRIDLFARDLDNFLTKNKIENPFIFGHSMGGYVALYHKANFENSPIRKIFTYGTKFNWSESAVAKELPMLNPDHIIDKFPQFAQMLMDKHGERWKQLMKSTAHMIQNLERLDGLTREDMSEIDIPVILILGDQDRAVTTEETHLTGSWLHDSQIKTISHSKHELERSNLREISTIIVENTP